MEGGKENQGGWKSPGGKKLNEGSKCSVLALNLGSTIWQLRGLASPLFAVTTHPRHTFPDLGADDTAVLSLCELGGSIL